MNDQKNIIGFFFKIGFDPNLNEQDFSNLASIFRPYIWGENGLSNKVKKLNYSDYGNDIKLVLYQFYVNPTKIELDKLKEIEAYRSKERAIGIPVIVNNEFFFSKPDSGRFQFLKEAIIHKLDLLGEVIKKRKLDTNIEKLKSDLANCFS